MKKMTAGFLSTVMAMLVAAVPVLANEGTFDIPAAPLGPGNPGPDVYLSYRAVDLGVDVDGSGSSINPLDLRMGFYAFTGERIYYTVVVRDQNGAQDINLVKWVKDDYDEEGPCDDITNSVYGEGYEAYYCVPWCLEEFLEDDPSAIDQGQCPEFYKKIEIDTSTNLQWDPQTDKLYKCVLTVESQWDSCGIAVVAEDTSGGSGQTLAENWNFNPPLMVEVDTSDGESLDFGPPVLDQDVPFATEPNCIIDIGEDLTYRDCCEYIPGNDDEPEKKCDVSFSTNKIVIENIGEVNLWAFIAAENFYASDGLAKCPFTNELDANQFEYRAMSGSFDGGWRVMPQYSPNLPCIGIGIGDSTVHAGPPLLHYFDLLYGQCRGGCRIPVGNTFGLLPGLDVLSPTHTIEVALKVVWPTPCIGEFDVGDIKVMVRAV